MARLFVAVRPPQHVQDVLAAVPRPPEPGVRWSEPAQWWVKLRPLGPVAEPVIAPLTEALEAGLDGAPTADCVLGPAVARTVYWLAVPVTGLDKLSAAVFEATEGLVPVTHPQPFRGNVVLARGTAPRTLAGTPVTARWTADEVSLVADRSSPRGPRFEVLAGYPLDPH